MGRNHRRLAAVGLVLCLAGLVGVVGVPAAAQTTTSSSSTTATSLDLTTTSLDPGEGDGGEGLGTGRVLLLVVAGLLLVAFLLSFLTWRYWRATRPRHHVPVEVKQRRLSRHRVRP